MDHLSVPRYAVEMYVLQASEKYRNVDNSTIFEAPLRYRLFYFLLKKRTGCGPELEMECAVHGGVYGGLDNLSASNFLATSE